MRKHPVRGLVVLLAMALTAAAEGFTSAAGAPREYPYPAEPQYQYPVQSERLRMTRKCPKGQAVFQGRCRIVRAVY